MENIYVAIIGGLKAQRAYAREHLLQFPTMRIVFEGKSLREHFKRLVRSNPHIVLILTGSQNTFAEELYPAFTKIQERIPRAKILLRTELSQEHPLIQKAIEAGVNVVDERYDFTKITEALRRVVEGEHIVWYKGRAEDLERASPFEREIR
ncbi:MAG: hypothetical protein AAB694_00280 [Patescibacteria group bacterium]